MSGDGINNGDVSTDDGGSGGIEAKSDDANATATPETMRATRKLSASGKKGSLDHSPSTTGSPVLGLLSLIVGLLAGGAIYLIGDHWLDSAKNTALPITCIIFIWTFAVSWLLISESGKYVKPTLLGFVIAAIISGPSYYSAKMGDIVPPDMALDPFPAIFWFFIAGPICAYLMIVWAKAAIQSRAIPAYSALFFHGLTVPLIATGAFVLGGLALALLFAWATLMKSMGVALFHDLFSEAYFAIPFLGAITGLAVSMMRAQQSILGALRYIALLFSRILMPITAVLSVTFLLILAIKGTTAVYDLEFSPAATMIVLAFAGMLIFNGIYQNGEGAPPALWLRFATILSLIAFPIYSGLAAHALWIRVGEYGLTPPRIGGLTVAALAFAYSIVCLGGLLSELNWRSRRWMPLVAPLNTLMVAIWVATLLIISSPLANPWAISARSQEALLANGKISAQDFDFAYLRFDLGDYGAAALDRLYAKADHHEINIIRLRIDEVRGAESKYRLNTPYDGSPEAELPNAETTNTPPEGPMSLELNPEDNIEE